VFGDGGVSVLNRWDDEICISFQSPLTSLAQGFFNSLQFSSMNTLAYADIEPHDSSMASTMASSFQQLSMSFGLATGSIVTAWYLGPVAQDNRMLVAQALHHGFATLAVLTLLSSGVFWRLRRNDGDSISRGRAKAAQVAHGEAP
jgi:hypothetical protein